MAGFEPLEFPLLDGKTPTRLVGKSEANAHGRECLAGVLMQVVDEVESPDGTADHMSIVEVGSWVGGGAIEIVDAFQASGWRSPQVYCVDTWEGGPEDVTGVIAEVLGQRAVFETFCRNVGDRLFRTIFPCVGRSSTWAKTWPRQVAAVYIDAAHEYEAVKQDLEAWWPHVLPGGFFGGHDYCLFPGVKKAVDEWHARIKWLELGCSLTEATLNDVDFPLHVDGEVWWVRKPKYGGRNVVEI